MKLRKVYVIVDGTDIFEDYQMIDMYHDRDYAERVCASKQRMYDDELTKLYNEGMKPKKLKVHAFYLLHEKLVKDS